MGILRWASQFIEKQCYKCNYEFKEGETGPVDTVSPIHGIDVSHWQPNPNWVELAKTNKFCFTKATEGITYVDPSFKDHWRNMQTHGFVRGAYHFFRPKYDAIEQAKHFVNTVNANGYLKSDMPLVCDFEAHDQVPKDVIRKSVLTFLTTVEELTGRRPIVYTGKWFIDEFVGDLPELANYPLWTSNYPKNGLAGKPIIPPPWTKFDIWQWTSKPIDSNIYYGTLTEFKKRFTIG